MRLLTKSLDRSRALTALVAALGVLLVSSATAAAAPKWHLGSYANTNAIPGETFEFTIQAINNGESVESGSEIDLTGELPGGMKIVSASFSFVAPGERYEEPECTAQDGSSVTEASNFKCVNNAGLPGGGTFGNSGSEELRLKVDVPVTASGVLTSHFQISGGGGTATTVAPVHIAASPAGFGVNAFDALIRDESGASFTRAGGHPGDITNPIDFNTVTDIVHGSYYPAGAVRDTIVDLPPGFVGNTTAPTQCSADQLAHMEAGITPEPQCPLGSQIGTVMVRFNAGQGRPFELGPIALFNMVPPTGAIARFGFNLLGVLVVLDPQLRQDGSYGVSVASRKISEGLALAGVTTTFWGNPASSTHDSERKCPGRGEIYFGGPSCAGGNEVAFLRMPTSCGSSLEFSVHADSWSSPGAFDGFGYPVLSDPAWKSTSPSTISTHKGPGYPSLPAEWGEATGSTGCAKVPVKGSMSATPTAIEAETPSGLTVHVEVPNAGLLDPQGISTSDLKEVRVALPQGMTINPSQAEGLGVCTPVQYASTQLSFFPTPGKGCPDDSKMGTVVLHTPLLAEPVEGDVYIAAPYDNPFKSLLAIYVVLRNPERGILIKLPAKVSTDPVTGQVSTDFPNLPQLPFSTFDFKFREGARAPLVTPPTCGTYTTQAWFTPWSDPSHVLGSTSEFQTVQGVGGGACPSGGVPPFSPQVVSGTEDNEAGSATPFDLHIERHDGEQELTKFTTILPAGLTGNLTGLPYCSDAAIQAARQKTGVQELASPSCPSASEIGHTIVGAGVGSVLAHTPGKIYLAGPYHGSALSIVSITSATVGPFDLGTVVIRFALRINPTTAQVEVDANGSDPIPHILDGIVVHVRDIRVYVDRPDFIRNPTSCDPMSITNQITGAGADYTKPAGQSTVDVSTRFQAANCSLLAFKPSFKASTSGKTSRTNGASLTVKLTYPKASEGSQANIRYVKVDLPKQLPSRLATLQKACIDRVFATNPAACPAASRVGMAKAITPILPEPLVGPAYFVSHGGAKFPELIVVIQGYGFTIDLHGETFISKTGITSSTFPAIPDEPVTSFELTLPQGEDSALAANGDLCSATRTVLVKRKVKVRSKGHVQTVTHKMRKTVPGGLVMHTTFIAQNGATIHQNTPVQATGCTKTRNTKARRKKKGSARHKK